MCKAFSKKLNSDDHFDRSFSPYPNEREQQQHEKHKQDIRAEEGMRISVPVETLHLESTANEE
jgi:hypothetical protein